MKPLLEVVVIIAFVAIPVFLALIAWMLRNHLRENRQMAVSFLELAVRFNQDTRHTAGRVENTMTVVKEQVAVVGQQVAEVGAKVVIEATKAAARASDSSTNLGKG